MTDKKKADQQASPNKSSTDDTSGHAQRVRLLNYMRANGSITTFEAIRVLNVLRPSARIAELRADGHNIRTHLGDMLDDQGRKHSQVATYYLSADPAGAGEVAA